MAQDIVAGLFGIAPPNRYEQDMEYANAMSQRTAMGRGLMGIYQGSAGLARAGMEAAGFVDRDEQRAQMTRDEMSGGELDLNDPASIRAKAEQMRTIDPQVAMRLGIVANAREKEISTQMLADRKATLGEVKEEFRQNQQFQFQREQSLATLDLKRIALEQQASNQAATLEERRRAAIEANQTKLEIARMRQEADRAKKAMTPTMIKFEKERASDQRMIRDLETEQANIVSASQAIANHPGLKRATGIYAYAPSLAGGEAMKVEKLIEEFAGNVKRIGLEKARSGGSIGQITEKEWKIVESMVAVIDPKAGADEVVRQMNKVIEKMNQVINSAKKEYEDYYGSVGNDQVETPDGVPPDATLIGNSPDGRPVYQTPDGRRWVL